MTSDKKQWSPFGRTLVEEFLDKIGISQRQLAKESYVDPGIINHMVAGDSVGFGQGNKCAERQYKILHALSSHKTLYSDKVRTLLQLIPLANLTDDERENLITRLVNEEIVKPVYLTRWQQIPFLGRDKNIREILDILVNGETRWLTIVGVPGVGKSELAWQVLMQVQKRGNFLTPNPISFDGITRAEEVERRITNALHGRDRQKNILLLLDDCEQIADNSDALEIINNFIHNDPLLTILATSRVLLPSENYPVKPLDAPGDTNEEIKNLQRNDSVQLFCESARRIDRKFRLTNENAPFIATLCIGLEGLPLGLLIAGSFVIMRGEKWLCDKLFDRTIQDLQNPLGKNKKDRHITLNSLIQVSYDLLGWREQTILRRLVIFVADCDLKAAQYVCNLSDLAEAENDIEFTNLIASLYKHSLVTLTKDRVKIAHATIRDYAERKLVNDENKEEAVQTTERYINYYYRMITRPIRISMEKQRIHLERKNIKMRKRMRPRLAISEFKSEDQKALLKMDLENIQIVYGAVTSITNDYRIDWLTRNLGKRNYDAIVKLKIGSIEEDKYGIPYILYPYYPYEPKALTDEAKTAKTFLLQTLVQLEEEVETLFPFLRLWYEIIEYDLGGHGLFHENHYVYMPSLLSGIMLKMVAMAKKLGRTISYKES